MNPLSLPEKRRKEKLKKIYKQTLLDTISNTESYIVFPFLTRAAWIWQEESATER